MKKAVMISISMLLVLGIVTGCGCKKKEEKKEKEPEIKVNTNENVIKDQELDVFTFTKTSLVHKESTSTLETLVTNTSDETQYWEEFKIIVKDEEGKEIVTMTGFVGDSIKGKESKTIISSYGEDLTKAASIEYKIVK